MRVASPSRTSLLLVCLFLMPATARAAETCHGLIATIVGTDRNDVLRGTPGDDVIVGLLGNDVIHGGGGNDVICGGPGNDTLFGDAGHDVLLGGDDNDVLHAGDGDDTLDGGNGANNVLQGGDGWDVCANGKPHHCESLGGGRAPVADAGADQTVVAGATVTLDGSRSSDADGDALTFRWSFDSAPGGTTPLLSDPTAIRPSFTALDSGEYVVRLIVNDGQSNSAPDTVIITTANSRPDADAGPDRGGIIGTSVTLDGSASSDADGNPLTFRWAFTAAPGGSTPTLSDAHAVMPAFTIDQPGTYTLQLIVNDGFADSEPDTVNVVTINSAPVANAGADQTAAVGTPVTLDGSASTDIDRDPLTFGWSILSAPAGSTALLSDPAAVRPVVAIDRPGTYLVQLIVNDGALDSAPDAITISTVNSPPMARAGADQTARVTDTVTLDGSASSDVDGDPLTFRWSLSAVPPGSAATIDNPAALNPTFIVDRFGTYVAQLIVNDGTADGVPDTVTINTANSAPVANAGDDQAAFVGDAVVLDGNLSSDVDGNPVTFAWSLTTVPAGSAAVLTDATAATPSFDVDVFGTYVAQLIVNDGTIDSAPDTVTVTTLNSAPVAKAGFDHEAFVGETATLDGTASRDADANPLTYRWSFTSRPAGSSATLSESSAPMPTFVPDVRGTYVAQLIVNDGTMDSAPDTVVVSTANRGPFANAGDDQPAFVGEAASLSCLASSDPDGDPYTCQWSILSAPAGSAAALSDATSKTPLFTPDVRGAYEFALVVTDDLGLASASDTVVLTTQNRAPAADAGADQTPFIHETVTLTCTESSDPDGDPYTCQWTLVSAPLGSTAALSDPTSKTPLFTPDLRGVYEFALVVTDDSGVTSASDSALVSTVNRAPLANAGADQITLIRETVTLACTASSDPDGDPVTCQWSILSAPAGSTAVIADPSSKTPTFTPDVRGGYEIAVIATDDLGLAGVPDTVLVATINRAPVANAGADQSLEIANEVTLNGGGSIDADLDPITFQWSITTAPDGSTATLSTPTAVTTKFTPDLPGIYIATLIVNDGLISSAAATVTITAVPPRIRLTLVGTPLLGVGRTAQAQVELPQPAPAGGVTVAVTSDDSAILQVVSPGTVLIAEGQVTGLIDVTGVTPGDVLLRANAPGFDEGTASMTVTDKLVELPNSFSVPLGQQAVLTVSIAPHPAPAGGVIIQLTTSDENVIAVSASVTILPGQFSANALVTGVRPGTAIVTATNPDFATDSTPVSTAVQLNIVEASATFSAGLTPPKITVRLQTSGLVVAAPSPGVDVTMTSTNPGCAIADSFAIATGISTVIIPVSYGGTTTLPCTATLTASSPGVTSDTVTITVSPQLGITFNSYPTTVGSGMNSTGSRWARLGATNHGGTTMRIESNNPALVLVSRNAATVGTPFIEIEVPDGTRDVVFVAHGLEGVTGTATITVTASKFTGASTSVTVAQPAARLNGVPTALTVFAVPDPFNVQIGPALSTGVNLLEVQSLRPGGTPVSVTVTSSTPAVAAFVSGATTSNSVTLQINPGQSTSANATLKPLSGGTTTVDLATPPGFATLTAAGTTSVGVTVTAPGITFNGYPTTVGSGMNSTGSRWVRLGATNHGGTTVRIQSNNPALVLVSRTATTAGTPFIEVAVADGDRDVVFVAHGLEGVTGTATITVSASGYTPATTSVTVAQPAARLNGVPTALTVFAVPDPFNVQIGPALSTGVNLLEVQSLRPGGTPVSVTVTSSTPAVAAFVSGATTSNSVTFQINPGQSTSANATLKPLSGGTTTVDLATPAGFATLTAAGTTSVGVTVTAPGITFNGFPTTVGSGMNSTGSRWVRLGATNHGGTTVRIQSNNPALVLVSRTATTAGTPFIEVAVADGDRDVVFVAHGLEGVTGTATITVSASGYTPATTSVTVAQPAARLNGVPTALTMFAVPDPFNVSIGPALSTGAGLQEVQTLRPGGSPVSVTVTSSTPAVAAFVSGATTTNSVTFQFNPGQSTSPNATLKPLSGGTTTVDLATPPGFATLTGAGTASVGVTVTTAGITFSGFPTTVGAGLQSTGTRWVRLGATNHGGITVRIQSSNPAIALISPNATTTGAEFIDVDLLDGDRDAVFMVHGVEGVTGNVVITVSAPGFSDGNTTASIQPAAIRITGLLTTATAGGVVDPFTVQIGLANATGTGLAEIQNVRPGGPARLITLESSDAAVGRIFTSAAEGGSLTVQIPSGQSQVAASFRPVTAGTTDVTAVAADGSVIETTAATVSVTVQ